jgi:CheY-like chemotaxis protein
MLGIMAGGIAHDFNNVLTAIMAYAGQARMDTRQPEVAEALDHILKASDRGRQLTRQILAFSRHEKQESRAVQLTPIVHEALALLRPTIPTNIEVQSELRSDAGLVKADPGQVHQIVVNLCRNAVQAMEPSPGRLVVKVARASAEQIPDGFRAQMRQRGAVCLSVSDNGHGMDAGTRQRIFEPFFTTKPMGEGTGLGLAVVGRIIREHGAAVSVVSEPGQGATFSVFFPVCEESAASAAIPASQRAGERILFVNAESSRRSVTKAVLEAASYRVDVRTSATEALTRFYDKPYDVVILDATLPGLNALEFATLVQRRVPRTPVLVSWAQASPQSYRRPADPGVYDYLAAPLTPVALLVAVRKAIEAAHAAGS